MKKIAVSILCVLILFMAYISLRYISFNDSAINVEPLTAKQELVSLNIIREDVNDDDYVSRTECLKAVLKIIGMTENVIDLHDTSEHSMGIDSFYYLQNEEKDGYGDHTAVVFSQVEFYNIDYNDVDNVSEKGEGQIAYGIKVKPYQQKIFEGGRNVKLNEAVAFIERCLGPSDINKYLMYKKGLKNGILSKKDSFYTILGEKEIKYKDLYIVLFRFLHSIRYKYIDTYEFADKDSMEKYFPNIDKSGTVRYIDWLNT